MGFKKFEKKPEIASNPSEKVVNALFKTLKKTENAQKACKMHLSALWKGLFFNDHDDIRYGIKYVSGRIHFPIIGLEKYGSNRP